jgi:hypothetical protein
MFLLQREQQREYWHQRIRVCESIYWRGGVYCRVLVLYWRGCIGGWRVCEYILEGVCGGGVEVCRVCMIDIERGSLSLQEHSSSSADKTQITGTGTRVVFAQREVSKTWDSCKHACTGKPSVHSKEEERERVRERERESQMLLQCFASWLSTCKV